MLNYRSITTGYKYDPQRTLLKSCNNECPSVFISSFENDDIISPYLTYMWLGLNTDWQFAPRPCRVRTSWIIGYYLVTFLALHGTHYWDSSGTGLSFKTFPTAPGHKYYTEAVRTPNESWQTALRIQTEANRLNFNAAELIDLTIAHIDKPIYRNYAKQRDREELLVLKAISKYPLCLNNHFAVNYVKMFKKREEIYRENGPELMSTVRNRI